MKPFSKTPHTLMLCALAASGLAAACGGSSSEPSSKGGTNGTSQTSETSDAGTASSMSSSSDSGASSSSSSSSSGSSSTTTSGSGSMGGSTTPVGGGTTPVGGGTTPPGGGTTGGGGTVGWQSVVGDSGFFSQTFDGQDWAGATLSSRAIRTISCVGTTVGWAAGDGGWIGHTADSGASWHAETSNTSVDLHGIRFSSTTFGVVAGARGTIEVTTDGGDTWRAASSGTGVALRSVALGYGAAFVVGDAATLVRSSDGGSSWHVSTIGGAGDLRSVASDDTAGIVLVSDSLGNVWASHDRGDSFTRELVGSRSTDLESISIARDGTHAIAVGTAGAAFARSESGAWTAVSSGAAVDLHAALVSMRGTRFLLAGDHGTLVESLDFGAHWSVLPLGTDASLFGLDDAW